MMKWKLAALAAAVICSAGCPAESVSADDAGWRQFRIQEITARIGKHFYSRSLFGEGFTVLGIIDDEYVKVRLDLTGRVVGILAGKPSEEWSASKPRETAVELHKRCANGELRIGMTPLQAFLAWCSPWSINTDETAAGVREQWVYENYATGPRGYLYFENSRLVAIQRRD